MFLENFGLFNNLTRYDYLQATEAAVMEKLFAQYILDLIAENAARVAHGQPELNVADLDIAGGGDGHTFVVRILVTSAQPPLGWAAGALTNVQARFWMGSDAEALQDYQEAAIASLTPTGFVLSSIAVGLSGAAKGTRFMAFMAGVLVAD